MPSYVPSKMTLRPEFVWNESFWTPELLGADLALWLDADDASTITLNGSTVSQWDDKSGNNRHLTQATAFNQPAYISNALNGKAGVRNLNADFLEIGGTSVLRNVPGGTLVACAKYPVTTAPPNGMLLFVSSAPAATSTRLGLTSNFSLGTANKLSVVGRRLDGDSYNGASSTTDKPTTPFIEVGVAKYATAQIDHFTNGTQDIADAAFQTAGNTSDTTNARVSVFQGPSTSPADTEIYEAFIIDSAISTDDRQKIEGYLAWKWNLVANLPANHPYKINPPLR